MNDYESYIFEALEQIQWDIPEDDIAEAAYAQAHLIAGCPQSYYDGTPSEYPSLR